MSNTTGVGTAYLSGAPEFTSGFSGVCVAQSLVFCVLFCRFFCVFLSFFLLTLHCLSFSQFSVSDYTCGRFKLFLYQVIQNMYTIQLMQMLSNIKLIKNCNLCLKFLILDNNSKFFLNNSLLKKLKIYELSSATNTCLLKP